MKKILIYLGFVAILSSCNQPQTAPVVSNKVVQDSSSTSTKKVDKRTPPPDLGTMTGLEAQAFYVGVNAVMWGYPSVFYEDFMRGRAAVDGEAKTGNPRSLLNQFGLVRHLRGPEFKQIATPNNDTYYAQAFCDVSRQPMVFSVPEVEPNRYYCFQIWDPNGDTFAYVGSRTTGIKAGSYAFTGPDWKGKLPAGVKEIKCEYNNFVIWGRIGVNGVEDGDRVCQIQDQLRLEPLSLYGKSKAQTPPDTAFSEKRLALTIPVDLPQGLEFYYKLAESLKHTPPKPVQDAVVSASLAYIGFKENNTVFDYKSLKPAEIEGLKKAAQYAMYVMDVNSQVAGLAANGWRWSPKSGIMGTDYLFRAAFAKWYTGGNAPEEAIYMDGRTDNKGQALDASKSYVMHFKKGELPHVKAFWSLSMYNISDGSFVANSINRYSIGSNVKGLMMNADGSLDIYIQAKEPQDPKQKANWLPTPQQGKFYMNLRLYIPDNSLANGTWKPPYVQVVE